MAKYILGWLCFFYLLSSCENGPEQKMKALAQEVASVNEKCPQMLDSETRLEGIRFKEPDTLLYRYTLVNLIAEKIDTTEFYKALWPGIISHIRVSPELKDLREANAKWQHLYQDKNQTPIYTFYIGPSDYK